MSAAPRNNHALTLAAMDGTGGAFPHHNSFNVDFIERWRKERNTAADPADHYRTAVEIAIGNEAFFPSQQAVLSESVESRVVNDGWGRTIRIGKENSWFSETLSTALQTHADLDRLAFEPPQQEARYAGLDERVSAARAAGRCVFAKIGGLYCRCHFLRGEAELLEDMALEEEFCDQLFDRAADFFLAMALETLRRTDTWETGLWIYDDMAGNQGPMFGPAMFERYFLPRYQRIIRTVKAAGCRRVIFHSDGNLLPVFSLLIEAGFDGFNPLEPRCGMDVAALREKYGKIYFGGVCNTQILPAGDAAAIRTHVERVCAAAKAMGGIIPGFASASADIPTAAYEIYHSVVAPYGESPETAAP